LSGEDKKTILLVEDEIIIAMLEKNQLESIGYIVQHVCNGEKAVKTVIENNQQFDLVLMDIDLGTGIDGTQTAEQILKQKDIPILFLSSHIEPEIVEKTEKITSYGYVVKNSGFVILDASIKMAMKLFNAKMEGKRAEEAVLISEENYRFQFLNMNSYNSLYEVVTDKDGRPYDFRFIMVNYAYEEYVGKKESELIGKTLLEVYPETEPYWIDKMTEAVLTGLPINFRNFSQVMNTYTDVNLYIPKNGQLAMTTTNINERKRAEEALHESELTFRKLFEDSADAILLIDKTGVFVECNQAALTLLKRTREQFLHKPPVDISPKYQADGQSSEEKALKMIEIAYEKGLHRFDWICINSEGIEFIVEVSLMPIKINGELMLHATWRDITERKRAEEEIHKQLSEKEILQKEIHHRIKNTIASIESLLLLQAESTDNAIVKTALQEAITRVQSSRVLYEKLLVEKELRNISIKSYIDGLIDSLIAVFPEAKNISIEKKITDFSISSNKAVSVGIIINELMTNIFKYAFKEKDKGNVIIELIKTENNGTLTITDNGIGIDERSDKNKLPGFGLTLVKMLSEQLQGTYTMENDNGLRNVLKFEI